MDEHRTSQPQEPEEPEVEGHVHHDLARNLHDTWHRDLLADADRSRQARPTGKERDGGILTKIRRFARREG